MHISTKPIGLTRAALLALVLAASTLATPAAALPVPTRRDPISAPTATPASRLRLLDAPTPSRPVLVADASGRIPTHARQRTAARPPEITAVAAAALIKPGDHVFIPVGQVSANHILGALAARAAAPDGGLTPAKPVEIVGLSNTAPRSLYDREGKIVPQALFLGANSRDPVAAGRGSFVPVYFGRIPRLIREGTLPVDVAVVQVSPPDAAGYVTLGPTAGCAPAAISKARTVIGQVNKNLPRTFGDTRLHLSELDYVVKKDEPLVPIAKAEITETDRQIAKNVVELVLKAVPRDANGAARKPKKTRDVPTFQFGIGGIPDAVAEELACAKDLKACKIRSELIGPGTQKLVQSGKVRGSVIYTFAQGPQDFLCWLDGNCKLKARTVDVVNDPSLIGRVRDMVAINGAMKVDLLGQVNAQYIKGEWYSGVGGQVDFMRGAMTSVGGKAIIALPSVAEISDGAGGKKLVSKIVPHLGEDDVVTTNMHDVQYVATEYGVAALEGKSDVDRARALIAVSHPQFRAELTAGLEAQLSGRKAAEQKRFEKFLAGKAAAAAAQTAASMFNATSTFMPSATFVSSSTSAAQ